jgi:general secretion pathway protein D
MTALPFPQPPARSAPPAPLPKRSSALLVIVLVLTAACAAPQDRAQTLAREGRHAEALAALDDAARGTAPSPTLAAERARLVANAVYPWLAQAEWARQGGRLADARALVQQALALDARNTRALALQQEIERSERQEAALAQAREDARAGRTEGARRALEALLRETPRHASARALLRQLTPAPVAPATSTVMAEAYRRPVTLEFANAPLRTVFEALSRTHGLNFVFDREVRADNRVSLMLRDVALDEALRVLLSTQQLERKVLNANTVLVYPATTAKQREHQELVTRTIYLTNADAKTTAALVRTIAKVQDIQIDERLNALVIRDAPAVVQLVDDLVASVDLPDPEVMIDVEVLEVSSSRLDEIGIDWPSEVSFGVFGADGSAAASAALNRGLRLSGRIANPVLLAALRSTNGSTHTLANPTIRARNREKAQVQVGDKLPVFSSTPATANVAGSTTVTYLDIGIKLDVEPSVQLDNEVVIKVALEASTLVRAVPGPSGSLAYQIGTRRTSTTLRLRDGETQILAGLMKNEDLNSVSGLPGLATLPVLGRLFGVQDARRDKSEVVLLMTPRILRNLPLPEPELLQRAGGTQANPGAEPVRLAAGGRVALRPTGGGAAASAAPPPPTAAADSAPELPALELSTSGSARVGETVSVTVQNRSDFAIQGELAFDPTVLSPATAGGADGRGNSFDLPPGGSRVFVLRVLPAAAGRGADVSATVVSVRGSGGAAPPQAIDVRGSGRIEVPGAR